MTIAELRSRLDQSRIDVVEYARSLSDVAFVATPNRHWSVGEQLHHLYLVENMIAQALSRLEQKGIAKNLIAEAPCEEFAASKEVLTVFDNGFASIPAFAGSEPSPNIDRDRLLVMLNESRHSIAALFARAESKNYGALDFPHTYLGRMNFYEWLLFVAVHESAHLRQMIADRRV
jgi:hypothetical protein